MFSNLASSSIPYSKKYQTELELDVRFFKNDSQIKCLG